MNIIVTGSSGFIGKNLVAHLKKLGHVVFGLDLEESNPVFRCDLSEPEQMVDYSERILLTHRPAQERPQVDAIVHLAAIGNIQRCLDQKERAWECNVLAFSNMLSLARLVKCKRVIYASSSAVYGKKVCHILDSNLSPKNYYGQMKLTNEAMASTAREGFKMNCVGLRFFNVIGPGQKMRNGYSALVPKIVRAIKTGEPMPLYNLGYNSRSFTPVSYVCEVIEFLINEPIETKLPAVINVGNTQGISVANLIYKFSSQSKKKPSFTMEPAREWEIMTSCADMYQEEDLPGFPKLPHNRLDEEISRILKDENLD